ncbi:MAG: hypothetical protein WAU01_17900 [Saprospiraceae bacterium]
MTKLISQTILLFSLFLGSISCNKENTIIENNTSAISFSDPQVGQSSTYVHLYGENYYSNNNFDYKYTKDTLTLEIISSADKRWLIKEVYKEFEKVTQEIQRFDLIIQNDSFWIETNKDYRLDYSRLLPLNKKYPLNPSNVSKVDMIGWKITPECVTFPCIGIDQSCNLFGRTYQDVLIHHDMTPLTYDGHAELIVYSSRDGLIRTIFYGGWKPFGFGWDLLR